MKITESQSYLCFTESRNPRIFTCIFSPREYAAKGLVLWKENKVGCVLHGNFSSSQQ